MGRVRRIGRRLRRLRRLAVGIGLALGVTLAIVVWWRARDAGPPRPRAFTDAVRRERLALIRDVAYQMGVTNAALFAGIASVETGLAHCAADAAFGCPGPASPSCDGAPVIAGGADGACAARAGGLGMFQLDAGSHAATVAAHGDAILTVEGNTAQAVAFVVAKVMRDVPGVDDWHAAVAWLNAVPLVAGEPRTEAWARLLACRYNGCCARTPACGAKARRYRDAAIALHADLGPTFWRTADRCAHLPADGVIDERTACHVAAGEPRYWRRERAGYGGDRDWTRTTTDDAHASAATWIVKPRHAGTYRVEAYVGGGDARGARYEIVHAGVTDVVTIDQAGRDGFVALGDFAFAASGEQYVRLVDHTGTEGDKLVADALRVRALDDARDDDAGGGCASAARDDGRSRPAALVLVGVSAVAVRRRRQTRRR